MLSEHPVWSSGHPQESLMLHALVSSRLWLGGILTNMDSLPYLKAVLHLIRVGSQNSELFQEETLSWENLCQGHAGRDTSKHGRYVT